MPSFRTWVVLELDDSNRLTKVSVSKSVDVTVVRSDGAQIIKTQRGQERRTVRFGPEGTDESPEGAA